MSKNIKDDDVLHAADAGSAASSTMSGAAVGSQILPGWGTAIGAGIGLASSLFGGNEQEEEEAEAMRQYQAQIAAAVAELEAVGIPSIEAQKIIVQSPELVGLESIPENLRSEFGMIETNPELAELQHKNLAQQQKLAETGLTDEDILQREMTGRNVSGNYQARQKSALSQLAQQGRRSGGAELVMQQQASQDAANRQQMEGLQQRAASEAGRREAIRGVATTAGNLRTQEHGEARDKASAIDRFNIGNRDARMTVGNRNLNRRQGIAEGRVGAANKQEAHNKSLIAKNYEDKLAKAKAIASARTGGAQTQYQGSMRSAGQTGDKWGNIGQAAIGLGGVADKAGWFDSKKPSAGGDADDMYGFDGYANGGLGTSSLSDGKKLIKELYYADGGQYMSDGSGDIVESGEESYEGDRVDAKLNDKELVINVQQQQRLLELLQGYRDLKGLGNENIVENPENGEAPMPMEGDTPPINNGEEIPMANGGIEGLLDTGIEDDPRNGLTPEEYAILYPRSKYLKQGGPAYESEGRQKTMKDYISEESLNDFRQRNESIDNPRLREMNSRMGSTPEQREIRRQEFEEEYPYSDAIYRDQSNMADGGMLTQRTGFYADGGKSSDHKYARGISEEYDKACEHAEELKEAQSATKKKIGAMEELLGIKDRKKKDQESVKNKRY